MQGKGVVRFFLIALTIVCLYQFALIIPTNNIENEAKRYADECSKNPGSSWRLCYSSYLDSLSSETVFEIPLIKKFTYADLKKSQLAMGLDLKGGMSVLLQVDLRDFLKSLAQNSTDPAFTAALDKATELQKTQQGDYITLFAQAWKETSGGKSLASLFAKNEALKGQINYESPDADVVRTIREIANNTVKETHNRLKQRIDKLGVVQPNVSLDPQRDLILVELPGIDNPERARTMLQRSAKLEFWDTYRLTDDNMAQRFLDADMKLRALLSGDTSAVARTRKDTSYVYPIGANGLPDSTKQPEMRVTDVPVEPANTQAGPLLSNLMMGSNSTGAVLGYTDKNKIPLLTTYLNRPEIKQLFPPNLEFRWSQKAEEDKGLESTTIGKYELYGIRKMTSDGVARLDGSIVTNASAQPDPSTGQVGVTLSMNNDGARIWAEMTTQAASDNQRQIAIALDDEIVSAPSVREPITGGTSSITGNFTMEEAQDLANILQVGKLPAGTHIVQESQVGPSLGADNINKSLITMILAVAFLCFFMYAYYAKGGIVSIIALLANIFFILGTLASIGTVLTLPGIAGIVLTLAAAVDANVIIYERIREELRAGLSTEKAIKEGFQHALPAIIDANVTTLLTAFVLMYFGLGPIKGFGTVLTVGIFSSMFTAVLMSRLITEWWSNRTEMTYSFPWSANWLVGFQFDWMGKRKIAYVFSAALIAISIAAMALRGFELGVDFKGGYSFNIEFDKPVEIEQLRGPLTQAFGGNPIIKSVSTGNVLNITTSYGIDDRSDNAMDNVVAKLHEGMKAAGVENSLEQFKKTDGQGTHIISSSQVTATVADDIRASSYKSAIWALAVIFLYLLVRFRRWQFSLGAVLSLAHDVVITLGFFALLHGLVPFSLEVDQAIIACILTVIGFSVNDTVIVYDRIREFIKTYAGKPKEEVFNAAINTTLSRTLITSGTVILVVLLLFLFGGSAIKGFAFGMLVGMIFGTYSSVFVASAFVVDLTKEEVLEGKAIAAAPMKEEKPAKSKKPVKA
jgi:SecD/SecF fusion protein